MQPGVERSACVEGYQTYPVANVCRVVCLLVLLNMIERLESESAIEISSQVSKLLDDMRSAMDRA